MFIKKYQKTAIERYACRMIDLSTVGNITEIDSDRRWTPAQLMEQTLGRVHAYFRLGLCRGDRVLVHFANRLEFFSELLAIWQLGGCVVPVDARLTPFEVQVLAKSLRPRFSVVHQQTDAKSLQNLDQRVVSTDAIDPPTRVTSIPRAGARLDDDALILLTSGSTGTPKGVVHTHRSLSARWTALRQALGVRPYHRTLCLLPTYFGHGLICNCLFPWLHGCDLIISQPFNVQTLLRLGELIDSHEITFLSSVPSVWKLALRSQNSPKKRSLQRLHIGSAPLSAGIWRDIQSWSGINEVYNVYGITETGSWIGGTSGAPVVPQDGLIGQAWGADFKVSSARSIEEFSEDPTSAGENELGMVWVRTPSLMKGYFEQEELTKNVVYSGWFMTGDLGLKDEQQRLFLRDRERDEINKGGTKVYPSDIDLVFQQHDAVIDVCTFGAEDELYGENVAVALVLDRPDNEQIRDLHGWMTRHLAAHEQPVDWYLLKELPRTSRGKIDRNNVKDRCVRLHSLDLRSALRGSVS